MLTTKVTNGLWFIDLINGSLGTLMHKLYTNGFLWEFGENSNHCYFNPTTGKRIVVSDKRE